MKVISVKGGRSEGYLSLSIENSDGEKERFTVSESDFFEAGSPMRGDCLGMREYLLLKSSDEYYRARLSALRSLSLRDNNEKALIRKLTVKGISRETAEAVAREMTSLGYINEEKQLLSLIKREANTNLSGPRKIRGKLMAKGYRSSDISSAMEALTESGEVDFEHSAVLLVAKKLTRGATEEEKKALLYKNGYDIC